MNALNRLSIRTRLYFGTVFSLVLLVVIGAMGYLALERTRNTLEVLFTQRVQTLTDMGELRTTLGDLRRAEKDIIINFNNTIEVSNGRDLWKKSLQNLTKGMADVRKVQAADASFAEAIDKALAEVKEYEAGISPVFEQIERELIQNLNEMLARVFRPGKLATHIARKLGEVAKLKISPRFAGELLVTIGSERLVKTVTATVPAEGATEEALLALALVDGAESKQPSALEVTA